MLAVEGLVTMKVRRGAYVTEMSRDDVAQVYHLLGLLESDAAGAGGRARQRGAARAAAARCTTGWKSRPASATPSSPPTSSSTWRCWRPPATAGRTQMVTDLRKVMKLNRHHSLFKQGRLADSLAEHRALMQAIDARDGEAARRLMRAHFESGLEAAA